MNNSVEAGDVVAVLPAGVTPSAREQSAFSFVRLSDVDENHPRVTALLEPLRSDVEVDAPDAADRFPVVHQRGRRANLAALGAAAWSDNREMPEPALRALVEVKSAVGREPLRAKKAPLFVRIGGQVVEVVRSGRGQS